MSFRRHWNMRFGVLLSRERARIGLAAAKGATSGTAGESRVRKRVVAASTSALASAASVEEGVLNDDDRERLQRAVAILQKYDPEAHNLYGQTRTWRARWNRKAR